METPSTVMGEADPYVYRVCEENEWKAAVDAGKLCGGDHDRACGFIHLSTISQVAEVLQRFFKGRDDLLLLKIDAAKLGDGLKFEVAENLGQQFPHFYGPDGTFAPIDVSTVVESSKLTLSDGKHVFRA
eukprot:TRINITY_DN8425_c0_g1_i1.p2 TRINITY_DN8425_c0_g1~~TRINITY_DN8425_c0_g1_i1.p2  ORF type:complete len:129 (+),score=20.04 TRINITY_DN8425_c0_g1_i1:78-464(+)